MDASLGVRSASPEQRDPGYLRVEFGYSTVSEIADAFRAMAMSCLQRSINRVLVIVGDDDRSGERALRDAATIMVLAGIPAGFRLALVAAAPRVAHIYRQAASDLSAAGVATCLFDSEENAVRWLEGPDSSARRAQ